MVTLVDSLLLLLRAFTGLKVAHLLTGRMALSANGTIKHLVLSPFVIVVLPHSNNCLSTVRANKFSLVMFKLLVTRQRLLSVELLSALIAHHSPSSSTLITYKYFNEACSLATPGSVFSIFYLLHKLIPVSCVGNSTSVP